MDLGHEIQEQETLATNRVATIISQLLLFGIIERGVPQAYVRARASSETLRSVHVSRVFSVFPISKWEIDTYQNGLGTSLIRIQTRTPL